MRRESATDSLCFSHRKEYVDWLTGAKREMTRGQRLEKTLTMLRQGRPLLSGNRLPAPDYRARP